MATNRYYKTYRDDQQKSSTNTANTKYDTDIPPFVSPPISIISYQCKYKSRNHAEDAPNHGNNTCHLLLQENKQMIYIMIIMNHQLVQLKFTKKYHGSQRWQSK